MAGKLYITEYNNYGDPSMTVAREPSSGVKIVEIGDESAELHPDTRMVMLYSTLPCKFHFLADSEDADPAHATPMKEEYEIPRIVHMGSKTRIATFAMDD